MKRSMGVLAAVICILALGATAQVTREEFYAAQAEVRALKAQVMALDARVEALENRLAPAAPAPAVKAAPLGASPRAEPGTPLTGRDLDAWKLARDMAQAEQQSSEAAPFDQGKPTAAYMEKTPTGDYVFSFAARWPSGRVDKVYLVRVTVYSTNELRADTLKKVWRPYAQEYWASLAAKNRD